MTPASIFKAVPPHASLASTLIPHQPSPQATMSSVRGPPASLAQLSPCQRPAMFAAVIPAESDDAVARTQRELNITFNITCLEPH